MEKEMKKIVLDQEDASPSRDFGEEDMSPDFKGRKIVSSLC